MIDVTPLLFGSSFLAGVLMFLAPCTLPLVPGFLAVLSAVGEAETTRTLRQRMVTNSVFFSLGFSLVFIMLGLGVGVLSTALSPWFPLVQQISGVLLIIFALIIWRGDNFFTMRRGGRGFPLPRSVVPGTKRSSFLLGVLFSVGWSPCVGPVLGSVLLLAVSVDTMITGTLLLITFSLGLSLSFILSAFMFSAFSTRIAHFLIVSHWLRHLGSGLLFVIGCLLLLGQTGLILTMGTQLFAWLGLDILYDFY